MSRFPTPRREWTTGLDLYRRLAASGNDLPVVFITARDESAVRDEAERLAGAGCYLAKPFSGRALLDAITQALGSQSHHNAVPGEGCQMAMIMKGLSKRARKRLARTPPAGETRCSKWMCSK
jgi:FixJ family two-component response regulator